MYFKIQITSSIPTNLLEQYVLTVLVPHLILTVQSALGNRSQSHLSSIITELKRITCKEPSYLTFLFKEIIDLQQ